MAISILSVLPLFLLLLLELILCNHLTEAGCPGNCEPNGKCVTGTRSVHCNCKPGFAGSDCSFPYEQCADGYTACYNGAQCVRSLSDKDPSDTTDGRTESYECDCDSIPDSSPFVIAQCKNPVDDVCERGVDISEYAFCTNSGTCRKIVDSGDMHPGCKCPLEYEGRHCQYRRGTAPPEELLLVWNEDPSDEDPFEEFEEATSSTIGWILVVTSLLLIIPGIFGYFVFARLKQLSQHSKDDGTANARRSRIDSDDLSLGMRSRRSSEDFDDIMISGNYSSDDDDGDFAKHVII